MDYESEIKTTLFDYRTIETTFDVPARGKRLYPCTAESHHDENKKQDKIILKKG